MDLFKGKLNLDGALNQIGRQQGEKLGREVTGAIGGLFNKGKEAVTEKIKDANIDKAISKLPETFDPRKSGSLSGYIEKALVAVGEKDRPNKDGLLNDKSLDALNKYRAGFADTQPLTSFDQVSRKDVESLTNSLRSVAKASPESPDGRAAGSLLNIASDTITAAAKELPKPAAPAPAMGPEVSP